MTELHLTDVVQVHLLISTRYASQRNGNVLISFNNKPLDDVPLITPFLSPALRVVGPLLSQVSFHNRMRNQLESRSA